MKEKTIYFLFTDTGTVLSRLINYFTRKQLNHVSIAFDEDLQELYSFGRKNPNNPFSGGFVREDIHGEFLSKANCAVYSFQLSEDDYYQINTYIKRIEAEACNYKYNFLGLIGVLLKIDLKRKNALFCSQFVATAMENVHGFQLDKPACFTTPADIREQGGLQLMYQGKLADYQKQVEVDGKLITGTPIIAKQSLIFSVREKVKQFVVR
ncbi:hypothetical protein [Ornithinibacillus halophilus]|uniref:Permuted papain-like amidase enzyme, YaeF/YiiX, C92 family n=1 Tax=Ornithinibacillus halophilus TaxID=930117 RepID=A0A1M5JHE1_9BACI|nr:hypothetical protein [Ornithinibacillus halophilus]SHG39669.1 hypothetical protein SAMN05216225_103031 [Ornithinibacillus halophilus]